jgi:hypothetical protein
LCKCSPAKASENNGFGSHRLLFTGEFWTLEPKHETARADAHAHAHLGHEHGQLAWIKTDLNQAVADFALGCRWSRRSPKISIAGVTTNVSTVAMTKPPTMADDNSVHHCVDGAP